MQLPQEAGEMAVVYDEVKGHLAADVRVSALAQIGDTTHGYFVIPADGNG